MSEKGKILIVEDEGITAKGMEVSLVGNGFAITGIARTSKEALAEIEREKPDLVFMDIRLPGDMDGIETATKIREMYDLPVIFLTAFADEETLRRAKITEPHGYLIKPYDQRLLQVSAEMAILKKRSEMRVQEALREAKDANHRLESQRNFFQVLFNSVPGGAIVVDASHRIVAANPCFEELFGLYPDGVVGSEAGGTQGCETPLEHGEGTGCELCGSDSRLHEMINETFAGRIQRKVNATFQGAGQGTGWGRKVLLSTASVVFEGQNLALILFEDITELHALRQLVRTQTSFAGIVGTDAKMHEIFRTIAEVADSPVPVLIEGESGTGKELVALAIHSQGMRSRRPFVAVNCAALPDNLLETELFGHVKGAFTGAVREKRGRFEMADGGTLFLDEVGELSPQVQGKLLRVLQGGTFERVGGEQTIHVDVRIISATNKYMDQEVAEHRFRQDLYYRLCVVPILMPSLRERRSDISLLIDHFLKKARKERGGGPVEVSPEAMDRLLKYDWPGNVRELQNVLEYARIKAHDEIIQLSHLTHLLRERNPARPASVPRPRKLHAGAVVQALKDAHGNKVHAARALGVGRATLYRFLSDSEPAEMA